MNFRQTDLDGVWVIEPKIFQDHRGQFLETYRENMFIDHDLHYSFVQDNISTSGRNTLRGLHYQKKPHAQAKLVMAVRGTILDVAVDLRKNSKTFGQHFSAVLSDENRHMMLVPEGFAHGFSVISEHATVLYKCSSYYNKPSERGLLWSDPELNIDWKIDSPTISEKDAGLPTLANLPEEDLFIK
ncbi:MAG: dTDP-4-dehydrorhamnose 3,5-epimerase [Balneolaceae bacterium]|nr:MAG: dTDP-4-dehydrorhamnose 3,5-epimerase [Balneolaceae bacterium]